jgi:hypothetical protein
MARSTRSSVPFLFMDEAFYSAGAYCKTVPEKTKPKIVIARLLMFFPAYPPAGYLLITGLPSMYIPCR